MKFTLLLTFAFLSPLSLRAAELRCAGVLGNSGGQGAALVKFGANSAQGSFTPHGVQGLGVVVDRYGSLWDRGGGGVLNRYSPDGRLLAAYPISSGTAESDAIACTGDGVLLLLDRRLFSLSVDAAAGTAPVDLKISADRMSLETRHGQAAASLGSEVFLVNADGAKTPLTTLTNRKPDGLALAPDGGIWLQENERTLRLPPENPNQPAETGSSPGKRLQFLDGFCYGHSHHSTIRRFTPDLRSAPGVVMGGNSGSFIGHVDEQAEVGLARGMARAGPVLYAVSGEGCVLHLIAWDEERTRFQPLRRIGAVEHCQALALDRAGRVWFRSGSWQWDDGPAAPLQFGVPEPEAIFALTMQESDAVLGYGRMWGMPVFVSGNFDREVRLRRMEGTTSFPAEAVGGAVVNVKKQPVLFLLGRDGQLSSVRVRPDGAPEEDGPAVTLRPEQPVAEWTSLASPDGSLLLAAGGGFVIQFQTAPYGQWKETARWNSVASSPGAGNSFGPTIHLAVDAGNIWISDTSRHRVLCLDVATRGVKAIFGRTDEPGDDLNHLHAPTTLACRGNRAVVFDSVNQRLMKLELIP